MLACSNPKLEIIELLLSKGSDLNVRDNFGNIALDIAILYKNISVVKKLIEHGSDVNNINLQKSTPLQSAVIKKEFEIVKLLLDNGADKTIETSRNIVELARALKLNDILELIEENC